MQQQCCPAGTRRDNLIVPSSLVQTLRNEIANLKSSNNWRKDSVEWGRQQYNPTDRNWNRTDSREHTRNRCDSNERNLERRPRDFDNRSNSRDRNGSSILQSAFF